MRGSSCIVLLSIGTLLLSAALLTSGAIIPPDPAVEIAIRESPTRAYVGETVDLSYHINLTVYTHLNVSATQVMWDQGARDRSISATDYPNATAPVVGEADGVYSASFVAPMDVGPVFLILRAVVDGVDHFSLTDYRIDIGPRPSLEDVQAPSAGIAGREVTLDYTLKNVIVSSYEYTGVRWDTQSHSGAVLGDYPSESISLGSAETGEFEANITLPDTASTIYYVIVLKEHDKEVEILSAGEGAIICKSSPKLMPASAPSHALAGCVVNITWTIDDYLDNDCDDITETAVVWSLQSHDSRKSTPALFKALKEYDSSSPKLAGVAGGHYGIDLTMPAEPCTVYYVMYAIVLGQPFMSEEREIEVAAVHLFQVLESPTTVLRGHEVSMEVQLSFRTITGIVFPVPGDPLFPTAVELYVDVERHANLTEYLALSPIPAAYAGTPGNFTAIYTVQTQDFHFVMRCQVLGEWFWGGQHLDTPDTTVSVLAEPAIGDVTSKGTVVKDQDIKIRFTIANVSSANLTLVEVRWDTASHAGTANASAYPHNVTVAPEADGTYEVIIKALNNKETIYYVVHAVAYGESWLSPSEGRVKVEETGPGTGGLAALGALGAASAVAALSRRRNGR